MCTTSTLEVLRPVRLPLASQLLTVVTCDTVTFCCPRPEMVQTSFSVNFGENALQNIQLGSKLLNVLFFLYTMFYYVSNHA